MAGDRKVGREAAKKALKEFSKARLWEVDENLGEIAAGETDRGAVIILATCVEDMLQGAIHRNFVDLSTDEESRLFGPDAPVGTFSAKIRVAHALGIIKRPQMTMCDTLREMRNACAHSRRSISFKNKPLRDMLAVAMSPVFEDGWITDIHAMHDRLPPMMKMYFMCVCAWLTRYIRTGSEAQATALVQQLIDEMTEGFGGGTASQKKPRTRSRKDRPGNRKAKPRGRPPQSSQA